MHLIYFILESLSDAVNFRLRNISDVVFTLVLKLADGN